MVALRQVWYTLESPNVKDSIQRFTERHPQASQGVKWLRMVGTQGGKFLCGIGKTAAGWFTITVDAELHHKVPSLYHQTQEEAIQALREHTDNL